MFARKILDERLDRHRGYILMVLGKNKEFESERGEKEVRRSKDVGWHTQQGRARHLGSFAPRDPVSPKYFARPSYFAKSNCPKI
jgi:hypothetical protein